MHLPEAVGVEAERPLANTLDDHRRFRPPSAFGAPQDVHRAVGGLDEIDAPGLGVRQRPGLGFDALSGERVRCDRDDPVAARRVRADIAFCVDVQRDASAPAGSIGVIDRLDHRGFQTRAGELVQRLTEHLPLERALVIEVDVPEIGAAGTIVGVA